MSGEDPLFSNAKRRSEPGARSSGPGAAAGATEGPGAAAASKKKPRAGGGTGGNSATDRRAQGRGRATASTWYQHLHWHAPSDVGRYNFLRFTRFFQLISVWCFWNDHAEKRGKKCNKNSSKKTTLGFVLKSFVFSQLFCKKFSAWIFQNLFVVLLNSTCYETHLRKIQLKIQFNEVGRYFKNMIPKQMSPLGTHTHMHTCPGTCTTCRPPPRCHATALPYTL